MAARFEEYGNPIYFHEYMEGGHSVGADHAEDATRAALLTAFLNRVLVEEIGRASCRERVCQHVSISVVAVSLKKTNNQPSTLYRTVHKHHALCLLYTATPPKPT